MLKSLKNVITIKDIFFIFLFSFLAIQLSIFLQQIVLFNSSYYLQTANDLFLNIFSSFIVAGLIEEFSKFLFFYIAIKYVLKISKSKCNDIQRSNKEDYKKIFFLALFFGIVFALFENIAYFIQDINSLKIRILTATLFHITIAVYYYDILIISYKKKQIFYFILAWLLHSFYNLFLSFNIFFIFLSFGIIFFLILRTIKKIRTL